MPDQADGLRSLFTRRRPSLLVVGGSDPLKAAVAVHFAREAAADGRATLLVDGTAGQLAQACNVACRHELANVVAGDVTLADIVRPLTRNLLLLPAARALARVGSFDAAEEARLEAVFSQGIAEEFAAIGTDPQVDLVVVHAEALRASQALDAFGRDARVVIVATERRTSLQGAYAEMKALARGHGLDQFEIVTPRLPDEAASSVAFANLAATARRFLEVELVDGGPIVIAAGPGTYNPSAPVASATPAPFTLAEEVPNAAVA